jgi:hypothetical protein
MQPALFGTPTIFFPATANPQNSNPHITVTLQVTNLPTFFARIWGNRTATVTASATAEAYNPANVQSFTPIAPRGVKPWLVANIDPNQPPAPPTRFITTATGVIEPNVIGEQFNLTPDCNPGLTCTLLSNGNPPGIGPSPNAQGPPYPPLSAGRVCARTGYAELQRCLPLACLVHGECPIPRLPAQHSVPRCESLSLWRLGQQLLMGSHGQSETSESTQWSQCTGRRMSDSRHRFGIRTGTRCAPKSWGLACCSFSILSPKRPTKYKRCHDQQFDCDDSDH